MRSLTFCSILLVMASSSALFAGQEAPDAQLLAIDENRTYRKVNDDNITGKDIVDLLLEEQWDKVVQSFIDYALSVEEVKAAKIEVTAEQVDAEVQGMLVKYAERAKINPGALSLNE